MMEPDERICASPPQIFLFFSSPSSVFDPLMYTILVISLPHPLLFLVFTVWPMLHVWGMPDRDRLLSHSLKVTASLLVP